MTAVISASRSQRSRLLFFILMSSIFVTGCQSVLVLEIQTSLALDKLAITAEADDRLVERENIDLRRLANEKNLNFPHELVIIKGRDEMVRVNFKAFQKNKLLVDQTEVFTFPDYGVERHSVLLQKAVTPPSKMKLSTVAVSESHSCALLAKGEVKCWGYNYYGQLGLGDDEHRGEPSSMGDNLPAVKLGADRVVRSVTVGQTHSCALLSDGQVKCWGGNELCGLGLGHRESRGDDPQEMGDKLPPVNLGLEVTVVGIAAGGFHTCVLLADATIKCWGKNNFGQLGLGDQAPRGCAVNEMGDNLKAVNLGESRKAVAVTAGSEHSCALLDNGQVKCWGKNDSGQLGLGLEQDNYVAPLGNGLLPINLGTAAEATAVTAGLNHTCVIFQGGSVKCFGGNQTGQLGLGDKISRGTVATGEGAMGSELPFVKLGNQDGEVTQIALGGLGSGSNLSGHTCALFDSYRIKCWGANGEGQLGQGDTDNRGDDPNEVGENLTAINLGCGVVSLGTGGKHNCAHLANGGLKCWGWNAGYRLGFGVSQNNYGSEPNQMGVNLPEVQLINGGAGLTSDPEASLYCR